MKIFVCFSCRIYPFLTFDFFAHVPTRGLRRALPAVAPPFLVARIGSVPGRLVDISELSCESTQSRIIFV